jgi:hypothetical protein
VSRSSVCLLLALALGATSCGGAKVAAKPVVLGKAAPGPTITPAPPVKRHLAGPCPHSFSGKLDRWTARLQDGDAIAQALAEMGMAALPDLSEPAEDGQPEGEARPRWTLDSVEAREMPLAGAEPVDLWVEAWFSLPGAMEAARAVRTAVLLPMEDGDYCVLDGPGDAQRFEDRACLGGPEQWPLAFHFAHVTDGQRMTLVVERSEGHCDGCGRSSDVKLGLWDVEGAQLVSRFDTQTFWVHYSGCPWPPLRTEGATVEWVGGFPKELLVTNEVTCSETDGMPEGLQEPCTAEGRETRYALKGRAYASVGKRELSGPSGLWVPIEDAGVDDGAGRGFAKACAERMAAGKLEEAKPVCTSAVARVKERELRLPALLSLAALDEKSKDNESACKHLTEALALDPGNAAAQGKKKALCK